MKKAFIIIAAVVLLIIGVIVFRELKFIHSVGKTKNSNIKETEELNQEDEIILQDGNTNSTEVLTHRPVFKSIEPVNNR